MLNLYGFPEEQPHPATACSWAPGRLDVFWRGSDSRLWHRWWENDGWQLQSF